MELQEFIPLERSPGHPYIEFGGQVTYKDRARGSKLGRQVCLSCPSINACPDMVIIVVLPPRHSVAWCDAIVPVMMALLARWWFVNCPARRGLTVAFSHTPIKGQYRVHTSYVRPRNSHTHKLTN
jgi:hypothetical protein